jgi:hypothetical protein
MHDVHKRRKEDIENEARRTPMTLKGNLQVQSRQLDRAIQKSESGQ